MKAPDMPMCEGPSFARGTQWLATLVLVALAVLAWRHADNPLWWTLPLELRMLLALLGATVAAGYWSVLSSRTRIGPEHIRQSGLLPRSVLLADIVQLKLIRLRGLEWLVTPRLVVRARGFGLHTFYCADPAVLAAVETLAYGRTEGPTADAASRRPGTTA
jgi:hypothetical protein